MDSRLAIVNSLMSAAVPWEDDRKALLASHGFSKSGDLFTEIRTELERHAKRSNATLQIINARFVTVRAGFPDHSDDPQIESARHSLEELDAQIQGIREKVKKDQSREKTRIRSLEAQWDTHKASFDRATGAERKEVASHFTDVLLPDFKETFSGIEQRKKVTTEGITDLQSQLGRVQQACSRALADFKASHGGKTPQEIHFDQTMASCERAATEYEISLG